jgi:hypothetical protein
MHPNIKNERAQSASWTICRFSKAMDKVDTTFYCVEFVEVTFEDRG